MRKKMNRHVWWSLSLLLLSSCTTSKEPLGDIVTQQAIPRVELMPNLPESYKMLDWKKKAKDFDHFVFDWNNKSQVGPLIWLDNSRRNIDQETFGLYTAIKDIRQGKDVNNGEFHESLNSFAAILGAGLV